MLYASILLHVCMFLTAMFMQFLSFVVTFMVDWFECGYTCQIVWNILLFRCMWLLWIDFSNYLKCIGIYYIILYYLRKGDKNKERSLRLSLIPLAYDYDLSHIYCPYMQQTVLATFPIFTPLIDQVDKMGFCFRCIL